MAQAKEGDKVKVHYTGKLDDGTVFDSSRERDPLEFEVGAGQVIAGFDKAVTGLEVGQKKTVHISSDDAYGPRRDDMLLKVSKDQLPENIEPKVGQMLQVGTASGQMTMVTVAEVGEEELTLDANHPLAGKDLNFEIELVEIEG